MDQNDGKDSGSLRFSDAVQIRNKAKLMFPCIAMNLCTVNR
jgi:hypothetical protein